MDELRISASRFARDSLGTIVRGSLAGLALLLNAGIVLAQQETLGSILAQGAKKIPPAELKAGLTSGKIRDYGPFDEIVYHADGRVTGTAYGFGLNGEWSVDQRGLQCGNWAVDGGSFEWNSCRYWYRLSETIYVLESKSDADGAQSVKRMSGR